MKYFKNISIESEDGRELYAGRDEVDAHEVINLISGHGTPAVPTGHMPAKKGGCKICGKSGHNRKNCPDAGMATSTPAARSKLKEVFDRIKKKRGGPIDPDIFNKAQKLRASGMGYREIGEEIGMAMSSVHKMLNDSGVVAKKKPKAPLIQESGNDAWKALGGGNSGGGRSNRAIMPLDKFQQVKIATSHDVPQDVIAKEMGLAPDEVQKVILSITYADYEAK